MSKETLSFISRTAQDDIFEVVFASYLKKDFISRALTLIHDSSLIMRSLRFHSNDGGIAVWENGKGIISANSWEDEDAGIDPDSLMRFRFPLLNGAIAPDLARETIIHDVISHLPNGELASILLKISKTKKWKEPLPSSYLEIL